MDTNQINGVKIIVIGIFLTVLLMFLGPKEQIVVSGAVGSMIVFGAMLASGNWPYTAKRRRRRRIGETRFEYWLRPIKELVSFRRQTH